MVKVGIVGLPIKKLGGDPQKTLLGNPMRSWALFDNLPMYGYGTWLYIGPKTEVQEHLNIKYGIRLIQSEKKFVDMAANFFDVVIVCGTRIQTTLEQVPWLHSIRVNKIFGALCYHNDLTPLPPEFSNQFIGSAFVTPSFKIAWEKQYPHAPGWIVTTGQVSRDEPVNVTDGSVVFVGHIHNTAKLGLLVDIAALDAERSYHVVSSQIRVPDGQPGDYYGMGDLADDRARINCFQEIVAKSGRIVPRNLLYHFLPPGEEEKLLNEATVGIDFSWNSNWLIDNSKIPYYLSYGLAPVTEMPAPSFRFVERFGVGSVLRYGALVEEWVAAISKAAETSLEKKSALRVEAGAWFSWKNVTFDVAAALNALLGG